MSISAPGTTRSSTASSSSSRAPACRAHAPPVAAARARGIPVISEIELGARLLANPIIGITGTNGKTTTTALLGAMFDAAGVAGRGGGQHRPAADEPRRRAFAGRMGRVRALLVPARGHRDAPLPDRGAAQPRARPPRPARVVRGLSRREAPHLRAADRRRPGDRPARLRRRARARGAGSSSTATTSSRPSR